MSTVTVPTVHTTGVITLFRHFIAAFLTDWVHTWKYTQGLSLYSFTAALFKIDSHNIPGNYTRYI